MGVALPSIRPGTRMLAVSVLTLDAGRQRLRLELNGKSERTTRPGLEMLHLPLSENGRRRAAARAEWYSVMDQPLQVHDVLA